MPILREIQKHVPDCTYSVTVGIGSILRNIEQFGVDLDPSYQRKIVWTEQQQSKFVGAALENPKAVPPFWLNWKHLEHDRSHSEMVDGRQRTNACIRWLNGDIEAVCPCGITVAYQDLDEVDRRCCSTSIGFTWNFVDLDSIEIMKFYLRLNSGGTIHSPEDLAKVSKMIKELQ